MTQPIYKKMKWQKFNSCFNWNIDPVMLSQSAQLTFIRHTYTTHSQQSRIERALGIFINCSQGISHASYTKWSWRQFPPVWAAATQSKLNGDWRRHLPLPHRTYVPSTESAGAGHRYTRLAALQRRRLLILRPSSRRTTIYLANPRSSCLMSWQSHARCDQAKTVPRKKKKGKKLVSSQQYI